jgi:hypothetical protein
MGSGSGQDGRFLDATFSRQVKGEALDLACILDPSWSVGV